MRASNQWYSNNFTTNANATEGTKYIFQGREDTAVVDIDEDTKGMEGVVALPVSNVKVSMFTNVFEVFAPKMFPGMTGEFL
ncbi:hypothetical protein HDU76_005408 [Blyttiomyces sp. JEL0837]|nr:hypothetical protein HDU76_005408 [Blyttiomyces sp. JEL0837]